MVPVALSFSPQETYIGVCFRQEAGPSQFKVYELQSQRQEEWQFTFDDPNQYIRQVIWTRDERHILLHPAGTNQLHVMAVNL